MTEAELQIQKARLRRKADRFMSEYLSIKKAVRYMLQNSFAFSGRLTGQYAISIGDHALAEFCMDCCHIQSSRQKWSTNRMEALSKKITG